MYIVPKFHVWGILDSWSLPNQLVVSVPTNDSLPPNSLAAVPCDAAFQTRASGECPKLHWALSDLSVSYCTRWWVSFLSFPGLTLQHTWYKAAFPCLCSLWIQVSTCINWWTFLMYVIGYTGAGTSENRWSMSSRRICSYCPCTFRDCRDLGVGENSIWKIPERCGHPYWGILCPKDALIPTSPAKASRRHQQRSARGTVQWSLRNYLLHLLSVHLTYTQNISKPTSFQNKDSDKATIKFLEDSDRPQVQQYCNEWHLVTSVSLKALLVETCEPKPISGWQSREKNWRNPFQKSRNSFAILYPTLAESLPQVRTGSSFQGMVPLWKIWLGSKPRNLETLLIHFLMYSGWYNQNRWSFNDRDVALRGMVERPMGDNPRLGISIVKSFFLQQWLRWFWPCTG